MDRVEALYGKRSQVEKIFHNIENQHFPGIAPINSFYRKHFNLVDLMNAQWYDYNESHGNHKWKSKLLLSIMRYFVANVWAFHLQVECETIKEFRHSLAEELAEK